MVQWKEVKALFVRCRNALDEWKGRVPMVVRFKQI